MFLSPVVGIRDNKKETFSYFTKELENFLNSKNPMVDKSKQKKIAEKIVEKIQLNTLKMKVDYILMNHDIGRNELASLKLNEITEKLAVFCSDEPKHRLTTIAKLIKQNDEDSNEDNDDKYKDDKDDDNEEDDKNNEEEDEYNDDDWDVSDEEFRQLMERTISRDVESIPYDFVRTYYINNNLGSGFYGGKNIELLKTLNCFEFLPDKVKQLDLIYGCISRDSVVDERGVFYDPDASVFYVFSYCGTDASLMHTRSYKNMMGNEVCQPKWSMRKFNKTEEFTFKHVQDFLQNYSLLMID